MSTSSEPRVADDPSDSDAAIAKALAKALEASDQQSRWSGRKLLRSQSELLLRSPHFDPEWYCSQAGAPRSARDISAAGHYLRRGAFLSLDPNPWFSSWDYYRANPDVAEQGVPALLHYILHGRGEDRRLAPARAKTVQPRTPPEHDLEAFDPAWYLRANPDVAEAGVDPRTHFENHGWSEGRQGSRIEALVLDSMLWRGLEARAQHELRALIASGPARERSVAAWALARWHAARGEWLKCLDALQGHDVEVVHESVIHPDAGAHLGVQAALRLDDVSRALWFADRLRHRRDADACLSLMNVALAEGPPLDVANRELVALYDRSGLMAPRIKTGSGTLFNRLVADITNANAPDDQSLVSVLVPCFDAAETIGKALDGLCSQTWRSLEIIVIDDASTDATRSIVARRAQEDTRIRLIALKERKGPYVARNAGLATAHGDFITTHDADDWSHPEKIAEQVKSLDAQPNAQASISHWVRVTEHLEMARWRYDGGWTHRNLSSLMIRRDVRDKIGYWDRLRRGADTEYLERLTAAFGADAIVDTRPGVPLAFGLVGTTNLSFQSDAPAPTQLSGPRRAYLEAARRWHSETRAAEDLRMAENPALRPFRAPPELSPLDPAGPLSDYDLIGASTFFDAVWYREANEDIREGDPDPVGHYLDHGAAELRDPGPCFSTSAYLRAASLPRTACPLVHHERNGRAAGPPALPRFEGAGQGGDPAILFVLHAAGPEIFGAERSALWSIERLSARGHRIIAILPQLANDTYFGALRARSAAVEVIPQLWRHMARPAHPETIRLLRDAILRHQAREVHVNTITLDAPLAAARAEGCRSVLHVRELPAEDPALCHLLGATDAPALRRRLLAEADAFVANSARTADWIACPERTEIWPASVDPNLFNLPLPEPEQLRVALVGSNLAKKGVADAIEVARLLAAQGSRARVSLIGPLTPDLDALRPWPPNVDCPGYCDDPVSAIAQADIVMNLSHFAESFGRTVLEAMAGGRPVIAYRHGTPADLIKDGQTGFLIPRGDTASVARRIVQLDQTRDRVREMGRNGRVRAADLLA